MYVMRNNRSETKVALGIRILYFSDAQNTRLRNVRHGKRHVFNKYKLLIIFI